MAKVSIEEDRLKEILKAAFVEVLEERRDLIVDLIEEAIEDIGLAVAIQEGEDSPCVSRNEVLGVEPRE